LWALRSFRSFTLHYIKRIFFSQGRASEWLSPTEEALYKYSFNTILYPMHCFI